jgi:hypothetical protein
MNLGNYRNSLEFLIEKKISKKEKNQQCRAGGVGFSARWCVTGEAVEVGFGGGVPEWRATCGGQR